MIQRSHQSKSPSEPLSIHSLHIVAASLPVKTPWAASFRVTLKNNGNHWVVGQYAFVDGNKILFDDFQLAGVVAQRGHEKCWVTLDAAERELWQIARAGKFRLEITFDRTQHAADAILELEN